MMNKGRLVILSGPSGVGKGTIVRRLLSECENVKISVSATTRAPRTEDVDGVTYHFKTKDEFRKMISEDKFLEWAEYNGNYYGTPLDEVEKKINSGYDVILEIEVQGAVCVMEKCPEALSIFIAPPCVEELRKRLGTRGSEEKEEIERRVGEAFRELEFKDRYDFIVVNDELEKAICEVKKILERNDEK